MAGIDGYTKLMLHCDGADESTTFIDSATGKAITKVGTAQVDTAQSKFGGASLLLDGNSDYLTALDSDDWSFGTGNFTVDFWVRFASLTDFQHFLLQGVGSDSWLVRKTDVHKLQLYFIVGAAAKANYIMTSAWAGLAINTWYHLAFVRNGTVGLIFIDGVSQTLTETTAFGANDVGNLAAVLNVGSIAGGAYYMNGWMDEIRISKGIARWTANFTPPTVAYTKIGSSFFLNFT